MSNAFLYPVYPVADVVLKSNPYTFPASIFAPVFLIVHGAKPSSPPWNGTVNLSWLAVGPVAPVESIEALNEPDHKLELGWPE